MYSYIKWIHRVTLQQCISFILAAKTLGAGIIRRRGIDD
jgi:hypothetical protein